MNYHLSSSFTSSKVTSSVGHRLERLFLAESSISCSREYYCLGISLKFQIFCTNEAIGPGDLFQFRNVTCCWKAFFEVYRSFEDVLHTVVLQKLWRGIFCCHASYRRAIVNFHRRRKTKPWNPERRLV